MGACQSSRLSQIPLKPLESLWVYQAAGSAVCGTGWQAVVRSRLGRGVGGWVDSYSEGAQSGSHLATESLCLCMERAALISRLYWRHTLPVSNLYCWFSLDSCFSPTQSCCFWCSCSFEWRLDSVAAVTQETEAWLQNVLAKIIVLVVLKVSGSCYSDLFLPNLVMYEFHCTQLFSCVFEVRSFDSEDNFSNTTFSFHWWQHSSVPVSDPLEKPWTHTRGHYNDTAANIVCGAWNPEISMPNHQTIVHTYSIYKNKKRLTEFSKGTTLEFPTI